MMIHSTNKATINLKITVIILLKKNKIYNLALILLSKQKIHLKNLFNRREKERENIDPNLYDSRFSLKKKKKQAITNKNSLSCPI